MVKCVALIVPKNGCLHGMNIRVIFNDHNQAQIQGFQMKILCKKHNTEIELKLIWENDNEWGLKWWQVNCDFPHQTCFNTKITNLLNVIFVINWKGNNNEYLR